MEASVKHGGGVDQEEYAKLVKSYAHHRVELENLRAKLSDPAASDAQTRKRRETRVNHLVKVVLPRQLQEIEKIGDGRGELIVPRKETRPRQNRFPESMRRAGLHASFM